MNIYTKELVTLSKLDKELDSYTPQINQINSKVEAAEKKIEGLASKKSKLAELIENNKVSIESYEEQIKELKDKLENAKKKNKEAKNEREISAASTEEHVAKDTLVYNNEEIERLNSINEVKEAELVEVEAELEAAQKELEDVKASVEAELKSIEEQKSSLYEKREAQTRAMDPKILAFYERIKKWAGNTAVVKVENQACYGCYIKINDKSYSDLIKGEEIVSCPHCGRVLYVEVDSETAEA